MVEKELESSSASQEPTLTAARSPHGPRRWPWLVLGVLALLAGGGAFAAWWYGSPEQPKAGELLEGKLIVLLRPSQQHKGELLAVEEAGAAPVRFGGSFAVEFRFKEPACGYLVWLDCEGQLVPLYPWNHDSVEVKDVNQPPPVRRAWTVVFSPPTAGVSWKIGKKSGLETVLLLGRRTPLDEGTRLGPLFGTLPVPKVRHRGEVAILGLDGGADSVSTLLSLNRGPEDESRAVDEPLRALMLRLREHFELIRAVRFAHVEESEIEKK